MMMVYTSHTGMRWLAVGDFIDLKYAFLGNAFAVSLNQFITEFAKQQAGELSSSS